jgi:deoxyribodipyrimidine photo-lyase
VQEKDPRVRILNEAEPPADAAYVLYWALVNRRLDSNHALAFAAGIANEQGLRLLIYEGLTCAHPWANDRFHTFILEGVGENAKRAVRLGAGYVFYHRAKMSDSNDVIYRLAKKAHCVVSDDFPSYIPAVFNARVADRIGVPYYAVEASCIVPMALIGKQQYAAYSLRPKIHKLLPEFLVAVPPVKLAKRWTGGTLPFHTVVTPDIIPELVRLSDIDHTVPPSQEFRGGRGEANKRLKQFLEQNLVRYARLNREPSAKATSQLSPYLHFGYISSLEIALAVREYAQQHDLIAEEFLEQLIVRRELAFNFARYGPSHDRVSSLPDWVQATLNKHTKDRRDPVYTRKQFDHAATHDQLWNACQQELLRDGIIHGYYRMYWGKKIFEWSPTPQDALDTMICLNDRYALDGRDPNTYTNILWCLGLHDRPWTERPIFGMVRYMSLDGMKRKTNVDTYLGENSTGQDRLF